MCVRRQAQVAQELIHETLDLDQVAQGIRLGGANGAGIAHLGQELGDDIVVGLDLVGQQGRPEELFERVDDTVEELEREERLDIGRGRQQKEEIRMGQAEDQGRRGGVREVDEVVSRDGVFEVEGQQVACGERA